MINKQNNDNEQKKDPEKDGGIIDVAYMDVQCHIVIKDKDTGQTLVNKRG